MEDGGVTTPYGTEGVTTPGDVEFGRRECRFLIAFSLFLCACVCVCVCVCVCRRVPRRRYRIESEMSFPTFR